MISWNHFTRGVTAMYEQAMEALRNRTKEKHKHAFSEIDNIQLLITAYQSYVDNSKDLSEDEIKHLKREISICKTRKTKRFNKLVDRMGGGGQFSDFYRPC